MGGSLKLYPNVSSVFGPGYMKYIVSSSILLYPRNALEYTSGSVGYKYMCECVYPPSYKGEPKCDWRRRMADNCKKIVRLIQHKGKVVLQKAVLPGAEDEQEDREEDVFEEKQDDEAEEEAEEEPEVEPPPPAKAPSKAKRSKAKKTHEDEAT